MAHEKCCALQFSRRAPFAQLAPRSDCAGGGSIVFQLAELTREAERSPPARSDVSPSFTEVLTSSLALSFTVNVVKRRLEKKISGERSSNARKRRRKEGGKGRGRVRKGEGLSEMAIRSWKSSAAKFSSSNVQSAVRHKRSGT